MARNGRVAAIDADGHILERSSDIARYLEGDFAGRKGQLWPGGQPWDTDLGGTLGMSGYVCFMGNHNYRAARFVEFAKNIHDILS